jgi:type II secretory pathway pseudopilin PulG
MKLRKKTDLPLESLTNDSTNLQPTSPTIDSPPAQEDSQYVLPTNTEVVWLMPEKAPDKLKNKTKSGCLVWLTIFLLLGIGSFVISLPSLLSCGNSVNKGKQAEARQNVGSLNRAQQAYYLDNQAFSNSFESLGIGIRTQTINYEYSTRATKTAAFTYGIARKGTKNIKSYVGGVFVVPVTNVDPKADKKEMTTVGILCEALRPGPTKPSDPTLQNGVPTCGSDTKELGRK